VPIPFRRWLRWIILLTSLVGIAMGASADDAAVVSVDPAGGVYQVGETLAATVVIENVVDLYGVDVRVAFDPARLEVVEPSVTPGTALLSPPWLILYNQVDNTAGTIWYVVTLLNPHLPVSGSGPLFSFHFRTTAPGVAEADIAEQTLSDINGELIPAVTEGAIYAAGGQVFLPMIPCKSRGGS
jgi:hypothetical protein